MKEALFTWGCIFLALNSIEYFKQRKCISKKILCVRKDFFISFFYKLGDQNIKQYCSNIEELISLKKMEERFDKFN